MTDIKGFFQDSQTRLDKLLEDAFNNTDTISEYLDKAIRYAVFNGGKRFRPALCYASAYALKGPSEQVDCAAAAIELIHCYSLVHDDLPSMDNDELRRGMPTCHIAFDEATAILAGDALQAYAFQLLIQLNPEIPAERKLKMISKLAIASGSEGVAAGQALDLQSTNKPCKAEELERIHSYKTGKIISACIELSVLALDYEQTEQAHALERYGHALGLAFQVKDDILDVEGCTEVLGKNSGADQALNKNTYPSLLGLEGAKQKAEALHQDALSALSNFGPEADLLRALSSYVIHRES